MIRLLNRFAAGLLLVVSFIVVGNAQELRTNISVHDPVMIKQDSVYHLFATGNGIASWSSADMVHWRQERPVFAAPPQWAVEAVPGFKGHIWAPDISYYNGLYYLYYSVSAFGKNTSCIGVATNPTLDTASAAYRWTDHGKLIQSVPGKTDWNAIDPNLVVDKAGKAYLTFGSFWDGIKIARLSDDRLSLADSTAAMLTLASRMPAPVKGNNPIEAPFIIQKGRYFYLFASIDYCCKGPQSTYKMIVGRSAHIEGPYVDKEGKRLDEGGGSLLLQGDAQWYGVGHNGIYSDSNNDYLVFHGYSAADKGRSKLLINKIEWKGGWPLVKEKAVNLTAALQP